MANPLKMLKLKAMHFQFIQELKIDAPPAKVWASLVDIGSWFHFDPQMPRGNGKLELWPGGRFFAEQADGQAALHAVVTHIEPGKLLRMSGPMGLSHLPVNNVFIFELQPRPATRGNGDRGGVGTLLRFCQRTSGYLTADVKKGYSAGWLQLFGQLKEAAEGKSARPRAKRANRSKRET